MPGVMTGRKRGASGGARRSRGQGSPGKGPARPSGRNAGIGDEAVRDRTGKTWAEWVKALDAAGCRSMPHKDIAELVHEKFGVGDWWSQTVTVGYEQATGLREKHQTAAGYQVSASKTVNVPLGALYGAWDDLRARRKWMGEDAAFTTRKATRNKSMRITWVDGKSHVEANFYAKGTGKSQVAVQHNKLPDARAAVRVKASWGRRLEALKRLLEG